MVFERGVRAWCSSVVFEREARELQSYPSNITVSLIHVTAHSRITKHMTHYYHPMLRKTQTRASRSNTGTQTGLAVASNPPPEPNCDFGNFSLGIGNFNGCTLGTPEASSPSATTTSSPSVTTDSPSSGPDSSSSSSSSDDDSTMYIVIGVVVGALLIVMVMYMFIRSKSKK